MCCVPTTETRSYTSSCRFEADHPVLHPISERLRKRVAVLVRQRTRQAEAESAFREFLASELPHIRVGAVEVDYDDRRALLTLTARSKPLANELLLYVPTLVRHLRAHSLKTERIVVR